MRIKYLLAAAALAIVSLSVFWKSHWLEAAQEPVLFKPSTRVALVDMTRVFAEHVEFKKQIEMMRREVEEAENKLKTRKEEIEQAQAAVKKLPAGSVKRTEAEQRLLLEQQTLQADVNLQKAKFMEQEARIYLEVYESVLAIIDAYATEQKIDLVVRFNGDPIDDRQNLQNVMQRLNRQVLFHQKGIDITDEIVRRANAK
ncbi:MAG TPA: OmpH family outer membrane protein [Pirellulales bacterium]|nr:OmpH family outer membrane protein [Pirellulales bacterium]